MLSCRIEHEKIQGYSGFEANDKKLFDTKVASSTYFVVYGSLTQIKPLRYFGDHFLLRPESSQLYKIL